MKIRIKNKKRFGIVLSIVLVLTAMISGTYSLFYRENTAQSKESYSTGILSIVAKSKSDNINLTNALPMTDEEGAQTEPYVFTIENTGNLDYNFNIRLLSTSANPINPDYIKLKIDDGEVTTLSSLTNSVIKDNITLKAKEVMDVSIRIWLASNTPNTEIGKSFNSKIVTEGQAVYTENNGYPSENLVRHIVNLYNNSPKTVVEAASDCERYEGTGECISRSIKDENGNNLDTLTTTATIQYNYATDASLMNDRLGGTTESLDGGNIRYYGANPANYIDIGDRDANDNVILWRIIGVFDGKLRVIRSESIGDYSWDVAQKNENSTYGINEWSQSDIVKLLNPGYENNVFTKKSYYSPTYDTVIANNSLYWNSQSGNCVNDDRTNNGCISCDFTSSGLSDSIKNIILDQTIYLGAIDKSQGSSINSRSLFVQSIYEQERGQNVKQNPSDGVTRTTEWTGKVALPYPSDFGYATDFRYCRSSIGKYGFYDYGVCNDTDWLLDDNEVYYWTVTPDYNDNTWCMPGDCTPDGAHDVRPVITLKSDLMVINGDGTESNPYVIRM